MEKREEQACNLNLIYISVENQPSLDTNPLETTTNPLHLLKHIHAHKHISSAVTIPLIQGLGHQSMTACHAQQTHKTHTHIHTLTSTQLVFLRALEQIVLDEFAEQLNAHSLASVKQESNAETCKMHEYVYTYAHAHTLLFTFRLMPLN